MNGTLKEKKLQARQKSVDELRKKNIHIDQKLIKIVKK